MKGQVEGAASLTVYDLPVLFPATIESSVGLELELHYSTPCKSP